MCYLNENEITGRRTQKVHGTGTGVGTGSIPKRKIYVGFSRSKDFVKKINDNDIYVGLQLYLKDLVELEGISDKKFLLNSNSIYSFEEIKNNPCEYIEKLARENDCDVDYSPAISQGLFIISRLETM